MRLAFILWLVVLLCLSLSPFEVKVHLHSMGRYHGPFHVAAFFVTTVLLAWSAQTLALRAMLSLLVLAIALGTELLEQWRFHNPYEWSDVLVDCGGILLGFVLLSLAAAVLHSVRRRHTLPGAKSA